MERVALICGFALRIYVDAINMFLGYVEKFHFFKHILDLCRYDQYNRSGVDHEI